MLRLARKLAKLMIVTVLHPAQAYDLWRLAKEKNRVNTWRRDSYLKWYDRHQLDEKALKKQRAEAMKFKKRPLISIIIPTYNIAPKLLRECLDSILAQTYDNWELCIADDASPSEATKDVLREYEKKYKNIRVIFNETNGHIAACSNVALTLAKGEYVSLMDHDDLLTPDALFETVKVINEHPDADLIYSDEDKIEDDKWHVEPFFKPDWSPEFLYSCNMITHFATIRRSLMDKVGNFRAGTEGAQDWDLFLRLAEVTDHIYHIPKIIYVWRKSPTSTAATYANKNYAYINQKKVIRDALKRQGLPAVVDGHQFMGFWRVRYQIQGTPRVSVIIPSKDLYEDLRQCLESVFEETSYPNFEVIVVDTGSTDQRVLDYYEELKRGADNFKVVDWKPLNGFNFSAACNAGAKAASGQYLLFLNNDTKVIDIHWMRDLLEHAQRPGIGAVGGKLLFPDGTIQHAGVVLSKRDVAFHAFYGLDERSDIFCNIFVNNIRNVSAVTAACLMVARDKFESVGGFDEKLGVTYNDVDLCLKLLDAGYLNVYTPFSRLYHFESKSVGKITTNERDKTEWKKSFDLMQKRWPKYLNRDPYYNDNFIQYGPGYRLED